MMKRPVITTLLAALTLLPVTAQQPIEITYNGTTATVSVPAGISDVTSTVSGANVVISSATTTQEYTYRLKGASADGSLVINGSYKLTLQLAGINLTNAHGGAAIDVECGKRIAVELTDGTVNQLSDAAGAQKSALYFKGHAEFEGRGTLNVTGRAKHAICAKEYMELKATTGTINILGAVSDGLHCGKGKINNEHNYFLMKGGVVNIMNVGSDGVDSDDYGTITIAGGAISINVGDNATGLKADSTITISGGTVSMAVRGTDSEGLRSRYATTISGGQIDIAVSGNGSKGIKGKCLTEASTVLNGGYVTISGGNTTISVTGANLPGDDGTVSKCMGMSVDADLTMTDGCVSITALGKQAYTYHVKGTAATTGGTLETVSTPWTFVPGASQYDMSAYIVVTADGKKLTDYSQVAVGAFTNGLCAGYATFASSDYGIMRIYHETAEADAVSFRLYDNATGKEYALKPATAITFTSTAVVGSPAVPLSLSYDTAYSQGDVNHDGTVNITDVTSIISHILGQAPAVFFQAQADVNDDGMVNIADVTSVIDMILTANN